MKEEQVKAAFDRVLRARDPERPYSLDLFSTIFSDFTEIHGDRRYSDDPAIVCGFAILDGRQIAVVGHQKGRDTNQRRLRNFGMPKPEGYRKALRVMKLAEKFSRPIVTFIDTPGAYPGIDAEERGQAEAIAFNLREMAGLRVPVVAVVLGEGGSGGALGIGIADRVLMMENSVYSVISPEGCASILWKSADKADRAAASLRLTAPDLREFDLIDDIVEEPQPWAMSPTDDTDKKSAKLFEKIAAALRAKISDAIRQLERTEPDRLIDERYEKFRAMGKWTETARQSGSAGG